MSDHLQFPAIPRQCAGLVVLLPRKPRRGVLFKGRALVLIDAIPEPLFELLGLRMDILHDAPLRDGIRHIDGATLHPLLSVDPVPVADCDLEFARAALLNTCHVKPPSYDAFDICDSSDCCDGAAGDMPSPQTLSLLSPPSHLTPEHCFRNRFRFWLVRRVST